MKKILEAILYPLQMICEFIDGERDILYKPKKTMSKEFDEFMDGVKNNHSQEGESVFNCKIPNCPHRLEDIAQMEDDGLTDDEWLIKQLHWEIEATAIDFAKWLAKDWMSIWVTDKWLWEHTDGYKPNSYKHHGEYYTEEELFELYKASKL